MYQNYLQLHCSIKCDMVLEGSQSQAEVVTVVLLKTEVSGMWCYVEGQLIPDAEDRSATARTAWSKDKGTDPSKVSKYSPDTASHSKRLESSRSSDLSLQ